MEAEGFCKYNGSRQVRARVFPQKPLWFVDYSNEQEIIKVYQNQFFSTNNVLNIMDVKYLSRHLSMWVHFMWECV